MVVLHFKDKFQRTEIKKKEFDQFINRDYPRVYNSKMARQDLRKIGDLLRKLDVVKFF